MTDSSMLATHWRRLARADLRADSDNGRTPVTTTPSSAIDVGIDNAEVMSKLSLVMSIEWRLHDVSGSTTLWVQRREKRRSLRRVKTAQSSGAASGPGSDLKSDQ